MPRRELDPDIYCPQAALVDKETADRVERRLARYRAKVKAQRAAIKQRQQHDIIMMKQQRMMLMGGGAIALMAVSCWLWYKKTKRGGITGSRRHLLLDDDNDCDFNGTPEELQQLFSEAAKAARQLTNLDQRDQLMMYGLYKQALNGDAEDNSNNNNSSAPSKLNVVARAKYDAWKKFTGLPKEFAMQKYCEIVYHFINGGASSFAGDDDSNADIVYHDDDEGDENVDEDGCPINQDEDYLDSGMMGIRQSTLSINNTLSQSNESGSSPEIRLRNAALSGNKEALEQAIQDGANLDDADESGQTALHFSADKGCIECMRLLLDAGADINATDQDGIGVLQTAIAAGIDVDGIKILLDGGADPDAEDDDGDSPRSTVVEEGRSELVELFSLYSR